MGAGHEFPGLGIEAVAIGAGGPDGVEIDDFAGVDVFLNAEECAPGREDGEVAIRDHGDVGRGAAGDGSQQIVDVVRGRYAFKRDKDIGVGFVELVDQFLKDPVGGRVGPVQVGQLQRFLVLGGQRRDSKAEQQGREQDKHYTFHEFSPPNRQCMARQSLTLWVSLRHRAALSPAHPPAPFRP